MYFILIYTNRTKEDTNSASAIPETDMLGALDLVDTLGDAEKVMSPPMS